MDSNSTDRRVSVVMPAFNIAEFVEGSVQSVLNQTFSDLELIVVNDASSDGTGRLIDKLAQSESRIKVIHSDENLGGAGARNLGLKAARFRYVALIDGDDLWHPQKLEQQMALMENGDVQLVYTAIQKIESNGCHFGRTQCVAPEVDYQTLLSNPLIGCSTVLLDYDSVGRPLMPDIRKRQDFAFWLKLLREGAVARGVDEPLTYYRVRPGSLSSNKLSAALYTWEVYRRLEGLPLRRALPSFLSYAALGFLKRLNR